MTLKQEVIKYNEYEKSLRRKLIKEIKKALKPHLYDSGFIKNNRKYKLFSFLDNGSIKERKIGNTKYVAYAENGMVEDYWGGAIETIRFNFMSIPHLLDILESIPSLVSKFKK